MADFESIKREMMASGKGAQLEKLAKSSEVARIGKTIDKDALKKAAAEGDQATLGRMLEQVMSTDDGKALLKKVSESFGGKG